MNKVDCDPYRMGMTARKYGCAAEDVPFQQNHQYHNQWLDGWHDLDKQIIEAAGTPHWDSIPECQDPV